MYGRKDAIPNLQVSEKEMPGVIAKLRKALEPVRQTLREWKFLGGDKPHCGCISFVQAGRADLVSSFIDGDYVLFSTFQWFRAVCESPLRVFPFINDLTSCLLRSPNRRHYTGTHGPRIRLEVADARPL